VYYAPISKKLGRLCCSPKTWAGKCVAYPSLKPRLRHFAYTLPNFTERMKKVWKCKFDLYFYAQFTLRHSDFENKQQTLSSACAWASQVQALFSCLQSSCSWHCTRLSEWALLIKRWSHCSFSTLLGSTWRSPGSTFQNQLWWSCVCSRLASITEHPVIWFTAKFQDPNKSSLFLINRYFFPIHLECKNPWIGFHVTTPIYVLLPRCIVCVNPSIRRCPSVRPSVHPSVKISKVYRPTKHIIGQLQRTSFCGSNDPTNSVKALKER